MEETTTLGGGQEKKVEGESRRLDEEVDRKKEGFQEQGQGQGQGLSNERRDCQKEERRREERRKKKERKKIDSVQSSLVLLANMQS